MQGSSLHSVKALQASAQLLLLPHTGPCFGNAFTCMLLTLHMKSLIIEPCKQALNIYTKCSAFTCRLVNYFCSVFLICQFLVCNFLGHADAHYYAYKFAPEIWTD